MAYFIEKRVGKRATTYRVQVTISSAGKIVHKESKSFAARRAADSWGVARDKALQKALELKADGDPDNWNQLTSKIDETTLAEISRRYRDEYSASFGRTVGEDLKLLERSDLFRLAATKVKASDIVAHIKRRTDGVKTPDRKSYKVAPVSPATAANDLIRLSTLFDAAWASFGIEVPREELERARIECRKRRLIAKAKERDRLVTDDEIAKLCEHFDGSRGSIPMSEIVQFAVASARRQDEITQLRWEDCDEKTLTGKVPRLKDPGGQRKNVTFKFTQAAWNIAMRQPRGDVRIFPYDSRSISSAFTRACKILGIENLTFHDLRHRAVTDLFAAGYAVHEVSHFSLHRSWQTLKRYMNATPDQVELR